MGEDGKALDPVFGAGLTGLSNLGNRYAFCYGGKSHALTYFAAATWPP